MFYGKPESSILRSQKYKALANTAQIMLHCHYVVRMLNLKKDIDVNCVFHNSTF